MKISISAAIGKNRELGKGNKLLWHIPEDFKRFKALTNGHAIIMGRKTWDSLPTKPLPNRLNIVISHDASRQQSGLVFSSSLEDAIKTGKAFEADNLKINTNHKPEIFVIGGGQIYQQAVGIADKLYLTLVDGAFDADTFFPEYSEFRKVVFEKEGQSVRSKYKFIELEK